MTFLSPIPAIIAAAVAVPTLLFFYMLKLRRRPVRVPSTMLWESAVADLQANVPLKWLRPSWLLLLHLLILAALLLALARPALDDVTGRARRIVIILDRSASMDARTPDNRTRFEEAVQRAISLNRQLKRGAASAEVAVIGLAAEARLLAPLASDPDAAIRALEAATPTDQPGNLQAALDLAQTILLDPEAEGAPDARPLIVLFSDGGFSQAASLTLGEADLRLERVGPALDDTGIDNLGIVALAARRDYEDPATVRLFTRVLNSSTAERAVTIELLLDNRLIGSQSLVLPPASWTPGALGQSPRLAPASQSTTLEFPSVEGGLVEVRINRPDVLASDNRAWLVLDAAASPGVLVVREGDPATPNRAAWIVDNILAEIGASQVRKVNLATYESLARSDGLGPFRLVVFDLVSPREAPPIASLSFGAGLPVPGLNIGEPAATEPTTETPPPSIPGTPILTWDRDHPVLRHVALDGIYIARPLRTEADGAHVLARGRNGPLLVLAERLGVRHLVVAFDLQQSNWPLHYGFPIFLASAAEYLTLAGEAATGQAFTTAEAITLRLAPDLASIDVLAPNASNWRTVQARAGVAALGLSERVGLWETRGGPPVVAVNLLDETESLAATGEALSISGREVTARSGAASMRQEIWPWLVMAAGVLLVLEWLIYAARMRV